VFLTAWEDPMASRAMRNNEQSAGTICQFATYNRHREIQASQPPDSSIHAHDRTLFPRLYHSQSHQGETFPELSLSQLITQIQFLAIAAQRAPQLYFAAEGLFGCNPCHIPGIPKTPSPLEVNTPEIQQKRAQHHTFT